jgi:hypothetical protein
LPFCKGTGKQRAHKQDLGETLSGSRKVATPYDLTFLDPVPWRSLCEDYLEPEDVSFLPSFLTCSSHLIVPFVAESIQERNRRRLFLRDVNR